MRKFLQTHQKSLLIFALMFFSLSQSLAATELPKTPLYGSVSEGDSGYVTGIAIINSIGDDLEQLNTGSETPVVPLGATYGDGSYYRIYRTTGRYATNKIEVVNPLTWKTTLAPSSFSGFSGTSALGMTYDGGTGTVYYASCLSPWALYSVTTKNAPPSASATKYCDLPEQWIAIAMDNDGQTFYGITLSGTLKKLDKTTKKVTVVGETGLVNKAATSAAIDPATGNLYFASWPSDKESGLYQIDKETAEATLVKKFTKHEHIQGMFFMPTLVGTVPNKPGLPTCSFSGTSLSGTVNFYMPGNDFSGNALDGEITWNIAENGKVIATGKAEKSVQIKADVTVEKSGMHYFAVYCSNEYGDGPKIYCSADIGPDTPTAVTDVKVSHKDGTVSLSWTAPTLGVNGKTLDAAHLTYDVYRLPSNEKVGSALTECSFTEKLAEPEQLTVYSYKIIPSHYGVEGAEATSPNIVLGTVKPPYLEDFENYVYVPQWTILDRNKDGHTWSTTFVHYAYLTSISRTWDTDNHDDMIVSPRVEIKGGYAYDIEIELVAKKATVDTPHIFSLMYGDAPTEEAMTNALIDKMQITEQPMESNNLDAIPQIIKARLLLEKDAKLNLGILLNTGRGAGDFELHSFRIQAPKLVESPEPVSNLKAVPDFNLKDECVVTFTAPVKSAEGTTLSSLTKIEILRNGELAGTLSEIEPGRDYTYTDKEAAHGKNTYTVYAYNDGGSSDPAETVAYTGLQLPGDISAVKIYETEADGSVHVEWEAPKTDVYGQPLNLEYVDYEIKGINSYLELYTLATDIKDLKADVKINDPGQLQRYTYVSVYAKNGAGISPEPKYSNYIILGEALPIPFIERFPTATCDYRWATNALVGTHKWSTFPGKSQGLVDVNGDIIVQSFSGNIGERAELQSGKIVLSGDSPRLSFYAMNTGEQSKNAIEAWVILEDGTQDMLCREIPKGSKSEWTLYTASLDKYKGKNIKLNFVGEMIEGQGILIDNVKVDNHFDYDLRVEKVNIVRSVTPGMTIPVEVNYANHGSKKASNYKVVLLVDDKEVASVDGEDLEPEASVTVSMSTALAGTDAVVNHKGEVRIVWDADEMSENNNYTCVIVNKVTANPPVTGLGAEGSGNGVLLTWKAPVKPTDKPKAVTEDFESYDSWETEYMGYWTLFDEDQLPTATMDILEFPLGGEPKSWFIFNGSDKMFAANYRTHSGDKCISNMTSWDLIGGEHNSDWIISPALWGHEQTISFYARQCGPLYNEDFEVYYSTGSDSKSDFKLLATEKTNSYEWTKYSYTLPEGANYFAIRCFSTNQYMLQIDDITYIPENGSSPNLELKEYAVWRDGEQVGTADALSTTYIDPINDGEAHDYMLTAVYNRGVSVPSNKVNIKTSGVGSLESANGCSVTAGEGCVNVAGYTGEVAVYTVDGILLGRCACDGSVTIPVPSGVCIVKLSQQTPVKLIVK